MTEMHSAEPSRTLANRYRLDEPLGEGGMALVVKGWDRDLEVPRALKLLLPELVRKRSLRERFQAEARIMARLEHPHIVRVFDVGLHGKMPYIAMELLPGGSLQTWLEANGPMPARQAVDVMLMLCDAVAHAHDNGVIHRDIKPHNVLVSSTGSVKLTDFGIARQGEGKTRTGMAMGTLGYVAPEQLADAKSATAAADVYSLSATLWSLLTNGQVERLAYDLNHGALEPVPACLRGLLREGLAQRVEERIQDVAAFRLALEGARGNLPATERMTLTHDVHAPSEPTPTWDTLSTTLFELMDQEPPKPKKPKREGPSSSNSLRPPTSVPRATPVPRPPDRKGPYVVRLSDEDVQATLEAREARRRRRDDSSDDMSMEGMEDRLLDVAPLDDQTSGQMLKEVLLSTARWMAIGLVLLGMVGVVGAGLYVADQAFDFRGQRAMVVEASRTMVDLVVTEGPDVVRARQADRARRTELEQHYLELSDAQGAERIEAAEAFVTAAEAEVASGLSEDPTQWTPEQREEVDRLLRMRKAVDAYQEAKVQAEGISEER